MTSPAARGRDIENAVVKLINARRHANSGAMAEKWDADTKDLLIEIKSTTYKKYSHGKEYFDQLAKDAGRRDKFPVIILVWDHDSSNTIDLDDMHVVCKAADFFELLNLFQSEHYPEYGEIRVK